MKLLVSVLVCVMICSPTVLAEPDDAVIESYKGSPNLPAWVAYSNFLLIVEAVEEANQAQRFISVVLGLDGNSFEGMVRIDYFISWFAASKQEIEWETALASSSLVCSGNWPTKSFDDIILGLDALEATQARINREHYDATLQVLSAEELAPFLKYNGWN